MREALVDVPVQINIWIRPECQKKQFEVIRKARPSILFLQSDGGRNEKEWEAIRENRKLYDENIDWECTTYKLYEDKNNGLYAMGKKTMDFVWDKVDRCIFLEDDIIPSVTYFKFCAELFEKYKDDMRISHISGLNYYGEYMGPQSDYFFAGEVSVWGLAMWRRTYNSYEIGFKNDEYIKNCILYNAKKTKHGYERIIRGYMENDTYMGHKPYIEFYKQVLRYSQNQLSIVPTKNMINCIGVTNGSAHSTDNIKKLPKSIQKVFFMKTYEITEQMVHPNYVVRDIRYDQYVDRIFALKSKPVLYYSRKLERFIRCIVYGDWGAIRRGFREHIIGTTET